MFVPSKAILKKSDQRGASLVEYGFVVALFAIVCIAAVTIFTKPQNKAAKTPVAPYTRTVLEKDSNITRVVY